MNDVDPLAELSELLTRYRIRGTCEADLQRAVEKILSDASVPFRREPQLTPRERPDFLVRDALVVELKVNSSTATVLRQLHRYAALAQVEAILLVTTRSKHLSMPLVILGKPVKVYFVAWI